MAWVHTLYEEYVVTGNPARFADIPRLVPGAFCVERVSQDTRKVRVPSVAVRDFLQWCDDYRMRAERESQ